MVVKRRTLLYSFSVILVTMLAFLVFESQFDENFINLSRLEPDPNVTWSGFRDQFSNVSSWRRPVVTNEKFIKNYRQKVVLWEGTVLRVDSFDKDGPDFI